MARPVRLTKALSMLPLPVAGAFAVTLAFSIRSITRALAWNADFVSPMVMAESLGTAHRSNEVIFGTYAPLTSLWFNVITRQLPGHRALWRLAPLIFTVLGLAALGWAVWRVAGRWPAMVMVAMAACGSTPVLTTQVAQASHGTSYIVACLLGAFLVFVATRPVTPLVVVAAGAMGVVAGLNIASDPLLLLVGIGPAFAAPLLVLLRHPSGGLRPVIALSAGVTGLSLAVALLTTRIVRAAGYSVLGVSQGDSLDVASPAQMWANLRRLTENVLTIFNADPGRADFGTAVDFTTPVRVLMAVLALAGVCTPLALLARSLASRKRSPVSSASDHPAALALLEVYWGLVVAGLVASLVFSRVAVENAPRTVFYLTPLLLGAAVALPLVARRSLRWRAVVGAGAALFCGLSLLSVIQRDIPEQYDSFAFVRDSTLVLQVLEKEGLHRGYASYGSASPLTFRSGGRIRVFPVILCPAAAPDGLTLCGFPANRVKSWYEPQPGPSFVIADPTLPWPVVVPPPAALGVPSRVLAAGSQTVFVYPYDVAERFGPTG